MKKTDEIPNLPPLSMRETTPLFLATLAMTTLSFTLPQLSAETLFSDDFESGEFSGEWFETLDSEIFEDGGAEDSANFANVLAQSGLLGTVFDEGATDFSISFYTRILGSGGRQFNVMVSNAMSVSNGGAAINLRYENGWAVFSDGWKSIEELDLIEPDSWYRVRITCRGWGNPGASYDIELSDADSQAFTSSVKGLTFYQAGDPNSTPAGSFHVCNRMGKQSRFRCRQCPC